MEPSGRIAGVSEPDLLTREQVQDVYDELRTARPGIAGQTGGRRPFPLS